MYCVLATHMAYEVGMARGYSVMLEIIRNMPGSGYIMELQWSYT